ncbi:MAG: ATP-grasp domain-containing protein [Solirubrobacteraceae bacterium]|nr:ATP-grasp domain-containing protein [Solirubrobacteraceae bacterium]
MSAARPIRTLLVANRGEIARRVFATCRRLGIVTVAVHGEPDADAPYVADADVAVALPGVTAAETFLRGDLVVDAALRAGADAIHPGYGFLAEDAAFARAVLDAGLTWIGPDPATIEAMGSKLHARELMERAGVPVLPGGRVGEDEDPAALRERAATVGYPLLVKASAGGGGRGMRRVDDADGLADAVAGARREATAAFGDGTVFLERLVERPRHVEVQILGDRHGAVSVLPERDCTVQRRHQKLIEESPAPRLDDDVRARLADAARAAATDLGYVGAGTVEFVVGGAGGDDPPGGAEIAFLEVNTRLQVEHPVTELVTGLDLVALQIRIAEGEPLPPEAIDPAPVGHAIEARIVAEDPAADWRPATGTVHGIALSTGPPRGPDGPASDGGRAGRSDGDHGVDGALRFSVPRPGGDAVVRLDSGVEAGTTVSAHFDSMLAKVVVAAPTRAAAIRLLDRTLTRGTLRGPRTADDLLVRALRSDTFADVTHHAQWLDGPALAALARPLVDGDRRRHAALAAALAGRALRRASATALPTIPGGFRTIPGERDAVTYDVDGDTAVVAYRVGRTLDATVDGTPVDVAHRERVVDGGHVDVTLVDGGVARRYDVRVADSTHWVTTVDGTVRLDERPRFADRGATAATGSLTAELPGTVVRVDVAPGDIVDAGRTLLVLEAMKMEHAVAAPVGGTVASVAVAVGDRVDAGAVLAVVDADPAPDEADPTPEDADPAPGGDAMPRS